MKNYNKLYTLIVMMFTLQVAISQNFDISKKYKQALDSIEVFKNYEAIDILNEIKEQNPNYAPAYFQAGNVELNLNNHDQAAKEFSQVILLNNSEFTTESKFKLGKIKLSNNEYKAAEAIFEQIIEEDNDSYSRAKFMMGEVRYEQGDYDAAIKNYSSSMLNDGNNIKCFYKRGVSSLQLKNYEDAISDLSRVLTINPNHENAYLNRARAYYHIGSNPEAKNNHRLFKKAHADYSKALEINPSFEEAFTERGKTNLRLGDYIGGQTKHYVDAIYDFKHALLINPSNVEAHYLKAYCNYRFDFKEIAINEFEEVVSIDPEFADAYYEIAVITGELADYNRALEAFNKLVSVEQPVHHDTYLYRGYVHYWKEDTSSACKDFKAAGDLGNTEALKNLKDLCKEVALD